jgi:hypothetical protein
MIGQYFSNKTKILQYLLNFTNLNQTPPNWLNTCSIDAYADGPQRHGPPAVALAALPLKTGLRAAVGILAAMTVVR